KLKDEEVNVSAQEKDHLGLTVQEVTPENAERLGVKRAEGVLITSVEPGSAADEAGLEQGDIIVEVDRKPINDVSDYQKAVMAGEKHDILCFLRRRGSALFLFFILDFWRVLICVGVCLSFYIIFFFVLHTPNIFPHFFFFFFKKKKLKIFFFFFFPPGE